MDQFSPPSALYMAREQHAFDGGSQIREEREGAREPRGSSYNRVGESISSSLHADACTRKHRSG
jgi:hypothetical protein